MPRARHFMINPGARRNPVLTIFGNPGRRNAEFTKRERAAISRTIGTEIRAGYPIGQASAIAYRRARQRKYGRNAPKSTGGRAHYVAGLKSLGSAGKEFGIGAYRSAKKYGRKAGAGLSAGYHAFRAANPRRETTRRRRSSMATRRNSRRSGRHRARPVRRNRPRFARARRNRHVRRPRARRNRHIRRPRARRNRHVRRPRARRNRHMRHARRNPRHFRRNPFSIRGVGRVVIDGLLVGTGAVAGYGAVKALDSAWNFPWLQTTNVPGTTATVGDTLQSMLHATGVTIVTAFAFRRTRNAMIRKAAGGLAAGAWLSVILDLARSATALPASIQHYLGAYPRMSAYPRLGATTGSNLIGPGSLGSRAATVQAAHARYGSYPVMGGASF